MIFETLAVGPLAVNCFIIGSKKDNKAVVIDAGGDHKEILKLLKKHNLTLQAIINTHAHFDHVGGVKPLQDLTGARFLLHQEDIPLLNHLNEQTAAFGLPPIAIPKIDRPLVDMEEIIVGDETIRVIHTPGHSPGSICFFVDNAIFVGDTLFAGSIGRTDLYGGSYTKLINSIKTRLFTFEDHVIVYPGHGTFTTIGDEKLHNPFF
ncbi:MAG: MBL fold metallo-hydrolase [Candidatus Brocadia sp.]|nr:MBL fold metallo-hydrolase [Candidatus Brocadia sp. AMX3]MDG5996532.1 MBL fold metallo-hydrolase [Candidatus Brocadia sp.]OQZ00358.1 MAG: MBL fold metallo-hydrolase [Candidatus Brocadia sp. UTAMX2]RIK00682.1 MAG: MBL fold metallo-hydrolase [Candidatus Brocadia sp.]